jgi:Fur family transcriptional regulator, ferric uptake regulator
MRAAKAALSHAEVIDALGANARDRATTHRVLVQLTSVQLLRRIDIGDHVWRFVAANEEKPDEPRADFVCDTCGTLEHLDEAKLSVSGRVPRAISDGAIEIRIYGRCDRCG